MSSYLLYSNTTSTTGKNLATILNIPSGTVGPTKPVEHLIRWGSVAKVKHKPKKIYNSRNAIVLSSNKLKALTHLQRNNIRTPAVYSIDPTFAPSWKFPSLARTINHSRGRDIVLCLQAADALKAYDNGSEYLIEYIPVQKEYRVHVFSGASIKISEKILRGNEDMYKPWIRNHETGHVFISKNVEKYPAVASAGVKAVNSFDLLFGAVDIVLSDTGVLFVLEVNTGPGLVASGLRKYSLQFAKLLNLEKINTKIIDEISQRETLEQGQELDDF